MKFRRIARPTAVVRTNITPSTNTPCHVAPQSRHEYASNPLPFSHGNAHGACEGKRHQKAENDLGQAVDRIEDRF